MRRFLPLYVCLLALSNVSHADDASKDVMVKTNEVVLQVNGVVCSFCAYGAEKKLGKLDFLNHSLFGGDGVYMDIHTHRMTLALANREPIDLKRIHEAITAGGYDLITVHLNLVGFLHVRDPAIFLSDNRGQRYKLSGINAEALPLQSKVTVRAHLAGRTIPSLAEGAPVAVTVDDVAAANDAVDLIAVERDQLIIWTSSVEALEQLEEQLAQSPTLSQLKLSVDRTLTRITLAIGPDESWDLNALLKVLKANSEPSTQLHVRLSGLIQKSNQGLTLEDSRTGQTFALSTGNETDLPTTKPISLHLHARATDLLSRPHNSAIHVRIVQRKDAVHAIPIR